MSAASTHRWEQPAGLVQWRKRVCPAIAAAALGMALVYVAGFADIEAIHNAAHDVRHAASMPCH